MTASPAAARPSTSWSASSPITRCLPLAHDVPDITEHEQVARDRAGQACDIVGIAGHEASGEPLGKMRRG